ncbi:MAG: hypothetical protein VW644_14715 [Alphaproteobacteria bacterium]|jgi:Flp pilus assembly protein protease CpaA
MLADFVFGLASIAVGGFLIIIALPRRRRRRRRGDPHIRELRRQARHLFTIVAIGAGLLAGGFGLVVTIVSLAGFKVGLV